VPSPGGATPFVVGNKPIVEKATGGPTGGATVPNVHAGPRFERGSKKRLAKIRLRGNWPSFVILAQLLLALLAMAVVLYLHAWMERTGRIG
jgi:hypothetical protein